MALNLGIAFKTRDFSYSRLMAKFIDGPDRTGPDPTRQVFASRVSDKVSDIVCFLLNSTTRARPDFVVDFPRKTRLENPDLF